MERGPGVVRDQSGRGGTAEEERRKVREKVPRAMGTGMALSSLDGPLGGSVRNGPSTMPTHHGYTTMTIAAKCSGRPWSP